MRSTLNPSNLKVIKSSKRKGVFLLVFSLMLVAMGASMVRDGHAFGYRAFGWFVCAFFALGVPVATMQLVRGLPRLTLDSRGFEFVAGLKAHRYAWSDFASFCVLHVRGVKMVGIVLTESSQQSGAISSASKALAGVGGAIPDQFIQSPDEVCAALVEWHDKYLRHS